MVNREVARNHAPHGQSKPMELLPSSVLAGQPQDLRGNRLGLRPLSIHLIWRQQVVGLSLVQQSAHLLSEIRSAQ